MFNIFAQVIQEQQFVEPEVLTSDSWEYTLNPEEALDLKLEWEQERRGIANGAVCDDGFRWSDEVSFNHLFEI